jgi:hypothetical protein
VMTEAARAKGRSSSSRRETRQRTRQRPNKKIFLPIIRWEKSLCNSDSLTLVHVQDGTQKQIKIGKTVSVVVSNCIQSTHRIAIDCNAM